MHVISQDAQTNQQTNRYGISRHKAMLRPAGCMLHTWPAGNKKDLGMACHTPPLKKAKIMPLPSLNPIPLKIW